MIRFGIAGLSFGQFHVRTIANLDGALVAAVADPRREIAEEIGANYRARVFADGEEMIRSGEIDAVTICVPPAYRRGLLEAVAETGIPAFIEKPWSTNSTEGDALAKIVASSPGPIMTGFSFRFHPVVLRLRELIDEALGRVLAAQGSYVFDFLPPAERWLWDPENGGGLFNENSCHLIDLVCDVLGQPKTVRSTGGIWFGRPSEEAAAVSVDFEGGGIASILIGGVGSKGDHDYPSLTLYCEKGHAVLQGRDHGWHQLEWSLRGQRETHRFVATPEQLGRTRYSDGLERFIRSITEGEAPPATVADGLRSVKFAEAIYRSIRTESTVSWGELR